MYDMTIHLQENSEKCLYEQIYEHIRQEIREGKLLTGERLPSTRSLAQHLQVARSTVDNAYEQLLSEGYIEARPYKGYFVNPMEELFDLQVEDSVTKGDVRFALQREEKAYATDAVSTKSREVVGAGSAYVYDFSPNGIDMSGFPFGVWNRITRNILTYANSELFAHGEAQGDYDLRLTICRYLHSSRGVNCTPGQIIVGAGNDYLLMLLEKLLGKNVRVAMENPTYKRAYRILRSFGYDIVTVPMDESGMQVSELRKEKVQAAYVMPARQFPTGIVMPIGRRVELLKWATEQEERYLIEDDYDSEFRFKGKPIPSLQASDEHGKVIYIGTFSKAIAPAIRVSYMVLPDTLLEKYLREYDFYSCTVSRIDQRILNEFIRDGYFERHLNKMRKLYKGKRDALLEALGSFEEEFVITGEYAGLHLLLTAKNGRTEKELVQSAAGCGVKVYGLSDSMVDETDADATVLMGFGGLGLREISEGVERLKKGWLR